MTLSSLFFSCFARMQGIWILGTICACARPARGAGSPTRIRIPDFGTDRPLSDYSVIRTRDSFAWFGGGKNGLRTVRDESSEMVRPPHASGPGPAQWPDADPP